jgi:hypothetical protein
VLKPHHLLALLLPLLMGGCNTAEETPAANQGAASSGPLAVEVDFGWTVEPGEFTREYEAPEGQTVREDLAVQPDNRVVLTRTVGSTEPEEYKGRWEQTYDGILVSIREGRGEPKQEYYRLEDARLTGKQEASEKQFTRKAASDSSAAAP